MKALIDQNISYRILPLLEVSNFSFEHISFTNLINASDDAIFKFSKNEKFDFIITLDADFNNLVFQYNPPPKIVWLRCGNMKTKLISELILNKIDAIISFCESDFFILELK